MLMVAFTVLTDFSLSNYSNPKYCWLSEDAMIYWFAAPVILLGKYIVEQLQKWLYLIITKYLN